MDKHAIATSDITLEEAKAALGIEGQVPGELELKKIYREKARGNHPDRNPGIDTNEMAKRLNNAYAVLKGDVRPKNYNVRDLDQDFQDAPGIRVRWEPPKLNEITFEQAVRDAGVPSGVDWQFTTGWQKAPGSYYGSESSNYTRAMAAYGRTDTSHVFIAVINQERQDRYVGGQYNDDIHKAAVDSVPIKDNEGTNPAWLYGHIVGVLKDVKFGGKFNSKVLDADDWKFGPKIPGGTAVSIKHWLVNSGQVAGDDAAVVGRKQVVEMEVSQASFGEVKPGYYPEPNNRGNFWDGKYHGNYYQLTLIVNGKRHVLSEKDTTRLLGVKLGGNSILRVIFGEYIYSGSSRPKVLTRLQKGKPILTWMSEHLTDLPVGALESLKAAAAQMK